MPYIPRYIGCKLGSNYIIRTSLTQLFCGPHCIDNFCGPRRTKTSINKCAWFICWTTQQKTMKNLLKDMNTKRLL